LVPSWRGIDRSSMSDPVRIGILISGRGSNMTAIGEAVRTGAVKNAGCACVISNKKNAPGLAKAAGLRIATEVVPKRRQESREEHEERILLRLREHRVDLVCLAGYMRLLSKRLIGAFPNRILNIHPSLLPAFPGLDAQRQAFDYGVKVTGATVHIVTPDLDAGPIILQAAIPVLPDDTAETLADRILVEEHRIYPEAVALVTTGRIRVEGRRVVILPPPG